MQKGRVVSHSLTTGLVDMKTLHFRVYLGASDGKVEVPQQVVCVYSSKMG